jgi:hypothetical protein
MTVDKTLDESQSQQLEFADIMLESTEVDIQTLKQIDGYKEMRYKDAIYMGLLVSGKRHGKGVMKYRNGR